MDPNSKLPDFLTRPWSIADRVTAIIGLLIFIVWLFVLALILAWVAWGMLEAWTIFSHSPLWRFYIRLFPTF